MLGVGESFFLGGVDLSSTSGTPRELGSAQTAALNLVAPWTHRSKGMSCWRGGGEGPATPLPRH